MYRSHDQTCLQLRIAAGMSDEDTGLSTSYEPKVDYDSNEGGKMT